MDFFKTVIENKSLKPVLNINITDSFNIQVMFEHCVIEKKINLALRHFFCVMQHVNITRAPFEKRSYITESINYFDIFGIVKGDLIKFSSTLIDENLYVKFV